HVDHGKTSFLDYIRTANVIDGESGGITQHIGAYEVEVGDKGKIAFLDTPGHEAFTAMRARGAQVTDIVVLVIAADDRVMPQTNEALDHALAAEVSIIIAINKCDKPNANPEKIKKQLADRNILVEDWGGKYQCVEISAKTGKNVDELLEKILLETEMLELKANPDRNAVGTVIESKLDKGKGPVATVLVQKGTLRIGDVFVAGSHWGKVRALLNEKDERIYTAGPSTPIQVLGFDGVPEAGDKYIVMETEHKAKEIATKRQQIRREQELRVVRKISLEHFSEQVKLGEIKELNILIKSDVTGSAQALADSLSKLSTDEVKVNIIRSAVGPITESDVLLAEASNAVIAGFHVRANMAAKTRADKENVQIRLYKIIYDLVDDVTSALEGMLAPVEREVVVATVEVRETFKISRLGTIAGCHVLSGKITRN
ncbi:MAG: translation initiation factor IF-2, partial [Calditrichia bacterium]|nr:translation initiation factor IF-2 [Calditrichia bacterium]